jgi:hypothetical protein
VKYLWRPESQLPLLRLLIFNLNRKLPILFNKFYLCSKVSFPKKKSDFGQITKYSLSRTPCIKHFFTSNGKLPYNAEDEPREKLNSLSKSNRTNKVLEWKPSFHCRRWTTRENKMRWVNRTLSRFWLKWFSDNRTPDTIFKREKHNSLY